MEAQAKAEAIREKKGGKDLAVAKNACEKKNIAVFH